MRTLSLSVTLLLLPSVALAQRTIQFDTISASTPAAISCGFCGGEKFGVVFRELPGMRGLRVDDFPLRLNSIDVALASATVVLSGLEAMCIGSTAGGTISVEVEAYAGMTAPTGAIDSNPTTGPWPGETLIFGESVDIARSVEDPAGSNMYNVMINTITVGAMVDAPNTYIRVAVTIPNGGSSASCMTVGLPPPGAVGLRDNDGRIADNTSFILAAEVPLLGLGGWQWNESPEIEGTGINGDWLVRLDVRPNMMTGTDAGVPGADAGPAEDAGAATTDAGPGGMDAGMVTAPDAGAGLSDAGSAMCVADTDCRGGQRCLAGRCQTEVCVSASDCAGGMTCVEGRCQNLCTSNADCRGGETCDTAAGYCAPVVVDGGCSCRASGAESGPVGTLIPFGLLLALLWRRRSARRRAATG